jgi:hypothetical protein
VNSSLLPKKAGMEPRDSDGDNSDSRSDEDLLPVEFYMTDEDLEVASRGFAGIFGLAGDVVASSEAEEEAEETEGARREEERAGRQSMHVWMRE